MKGQTHTRMPVRGSTRARWPLAVLLTICITCASGWGQLAALEERAAASINFTYSHGPFNFTLSKDARQRSVVNLGQSERFRVFLRKLAAGEPVRVVVFGGSVTAGNGIAIDERQLNRALRFSGVFESWMNSAFPVTSPLPPGPTVDPGFASRHKVVNKAVSASDSCFLARTVRARMAPSGDRLPTEAEHPSAEWKKEGLHKQNMLGTVDNADLVHKSLPAARI
jgi:hypothetical protein